MTKITDLILCARCGDETSSGTLKAGNEPAVIVVAGEPDGFLGVIPYTTSKVGARVCRACGAIELFAQDVRNLLRLEDSTDEQ